MNPAKAVERPPARAVVADADRLGDVPVPGCSAGHVQREAAKWMQTAEAVEDDAASGTRCGRGRRRPGDGDRIGEDDGEYDAGLKSAGTAMYQRLGKVPHLIAAL